MVDNLIRMGFGLFRNLLSKSFKKTGVARRSLPSLKARISEDWIRWEPVPHLRTRYCIESVCDNRNGLTIVLSEDENLARQMQIRFKDSVSGYRQTDELLRSQLVEQLDQKYGAQFYTQRPFFRVTNSSYLSWLSEQSSTISDRMHLMHFVIFDPDTAIDIAATYEPVMETITLVGYKE